MEPLKQIAALPYVETERSSLVLLITTRGMGRWSIPKGWPKPGLSYPELAAREAFEEAGVKHLRRRVSRERSAAVRLAVSSIPSAYPCSLGSAVVSKSTFWKSIASTYPGQKRRAADLCGSRQVGRRRSYANHHLQASCASLVARRRALLKFAVRLRVWR